MDGTLFLRCRTSGDEPAFPDSIKEEFGSQTARSFSSGDWRAQMEFATESELLRRLAVPLPERRL